MQRREDEFRGERGTRIYFRVWRPEAPRAIIVLVHGLGEHGGRYAHVVDCLVPRGFAVYAPDLRGHGCSDGLRGHVHRFTDYIGDVARLLDGVQAQEPGLPIFLYGHSLGALIVLEWARQRPDGLQGVIASGPALRRRFQVPPAKLLLARLVSRVWPTLSQRTGLPAHLLSHDAQVVADYVADPLVHDLASARLFTEATRAGEDLMARAFELSAPCLFLQAGEDGLVDAGATRWFFERLASADKTLHVYEGFYHELHNEVERQRPLADLAGWLEAHLPQA